MALVEKLPYETDLVVPQGATFQSAIQWLPGGVPCDFTGWDGWMPLGRDLDDPLLELTVSNGDIQFGSDGMVYITMSPEQTAELAVLDIPTKRGTSTLFYNLTLKDPLGVVWRFLRGKMFIEHDVQRPK